MRFYAELRTDEDYTQSAFRQNVLLDKVVFLDIDSFQKLSYRCILKHFPKTIFFLFYRILFGFIYKENKKDLFNSLAKEHFGALKSQG